MSNIILNVVGPFQMYKKFHFTRYRLMNYLRRRQKDKHNTNNTQLIRYVNLISILLWTFTFLLSASFRKFAAIEIIAFLPPVCTYVCIGIDKMSN